MRHHKVGRKLNRSSSHRRLLFKNMVKSLIINKIIKTTLPKAKELRRLVEPLVTISKIDNLYNRRFIFSFVNDTKLVSIFFDKIGPKFVNCSGGYVRILKCGFRTGDKAIMSYIELSY